MSILLTRRWRTAAALVAVVTLASGAARGLAAVEQQGRPKGRLFPAQDLGLLEAPDRDQWNKPDQIMDALRIAEGSVVADLGAGGGWFTIRLSRRVGPNGRVYAEDIQRQMIEAIGRRVQREGLANVQTVLGTAEDPRLPAAVDAVLIVDAYNELEDPIGLLKNVARYLKPQGRVGVVEFLAGGGGPGPAPDERVSPDVVIRAAEAAGLTLEERETIPPFMYLLVFGKSAAARATP
jgi:ubiquinone/menaquinone biosynthesis C-methylase UbiE